MKEYLFGRELEAMEMVVISMDVKMYVFQIVLLIPVMTQFASKLQVKIILVRILLLQIVNFQVVGLGVE